MKPKRRIQWVFLIAEPPLTGPQHWTETRRVPKLPDITILYLCIHLRLHLCVSAPTSILKSRTKRCRSACRSAELGKRSEVEGGQCCYWVTRSRRRRGGTRWRRRGARRRWAPPRSGRGAPRRRRHRRSWSRGARGPRSPLPPAGPASAGTRWSPTLRDPPPWVGALDSRIRVREVGEVRVVVTEVDGAAGDGVGEVAGGGVGVVEHRGEGGAQGRDGLLHLPSHASAAAKRWGRRRRVRIWGNGGFPFASFKTILARGRGQKKERCFWHLGPGPGLSRKKSVPALEQIWTEADRTWA